MLYTAETFSWEALLDEYFFSHILRPDTEWSYRKVVRGFIRFMGEAASPAQVTHRDVLRWRRHLLLEKKQSSHTWNNKVAHLRAIFNFGMEQKLLPHTENPFNNAVVKKEKKKKKILSESQINRINLLMGKFAEDERTQVAPKGGRCALYPTWYWSTVLATLRFTGMRQNQLLHLRLRDINLEGNSIELGLAGSKNHCEWEVPIVHPLKPRLAHLIERATAAGAESGDPIFDLSRLSVPHPSRLSRYKYDINREKQQLRSFFRRLSRECDFAVSPHRFRHTVASTLMKAPDRNLPLVKRLLGHRNVATTMEYIDLDMEVTGKTLERELGLYTDRADESGGENE
ncbi:tyrosine-type recombinase/integrase [Xenorhabdus bovienii]|uniref:tyrosine-type recombinase/integrase n=1 Tax=Xenorhabdus bovienii TaxID=40576 RepID=UPI00237D0AC7|nr:site-specific integrase [Xenorhabdus bovienii]MDE1475340.1 tyrosine-type recombinase/integrase [Xenorhabdus bovienii]MDE9462633.1 tyrosine-type recombinase/integrase [Xenorhabdus bovienii]MDE9470437.1 tyrosine-type recombinase/integrase [Xenorhabdus bovienii]